MYSETYMFWKRIRRCCNSCGIGLNTLDDICGLQRGISSFLEEHDMFAPEAVLKRYSLFFGMTRDELLGVAKADTVEVSRNIFVVKNADCIKPYYSLESIVGRVCIDVSSGDGCEYVGVVVEDDSMENARIFKGDIAVIRRQAIADDGDVVVAKVGEKTFIRRYFSKKNVIWIKPEGFCDDENRVVADLLGAMERKIHILGKVVYTMRFFEEI